PFVGKAVRRPLTADDAGVTAPPPGGRFSTSTRAYRVQRQVADELERMGFGLDENGVIAPLEAVTGLAVAPVEMLRIAGVQPLHASREVRIRRSHQHVVMRRH